MAARDIQRKFYFWTNFFLVHEIRKKIQGLDHKQSQEVTDFEVYG